MDGLDPLEIGAPPFKGFVIGMADIVSDVGSLPTDFTYSAHDEISFLIESPESAKIRA